MPSNRYFYENRIIVAERPPIDGSWVYSQKFEGYLLASKLARKWEDLRFPATGINPPGPTGAPTFDQTKLGWLFPHNSTTELGVIVQLPHGWVNGTELRPHVHWEKSTSAAGNVYWEIEYQWSKPNTARTTPVIVGNQVSVFSVNVLDTQDLTAFTPIPGVGYVDSDTLIIKLRRVYNKELGPEGEEVDVDTYGAAARLLEFDIHYLSDDFGSTDEFPF
jgi:hypothetical protein